MKLRFYQTAAIRSIFQYFEAGNKGHPLVVAPTGSGKSAILAGFCAEVHKRWPSEKVLIVTHTKEIISQDAEALRIFLPPELVGVYSQGLGYRQTRQFTVAGIQSIYKKAELFKDYKLVIVDEAHLIPPDGEGRYQTFLGELDARIVGLTATPFRRGHGMLTDNHLFDQIVYDIKIDMLIKHGYLAPITSKATDYALDVSGLRMIGGDYSKSDLSKRLDHKHITEAIVSELIKFKDKRAHWLVFAIDIEHCEHIAETLTKHGILAAAVHSKLDIDRKDLLDLYKGGHIQALVSVETLTTGFDAPATDLLVLMRPTASPVLHVQMIGRSMRVSPGKINAMVLDFAGNIARLGPVDMVEVRPVKKRGKGNGQGITRTCPECNEIVHVSKKQCPSCGYVFPVQTKLTITPSDAAVLASDKRVFTKDVKQVRYSKHIKAGKPPSFKVTYICGPLNIFHEWIGFEHPGYPRTRAIKWWRQHANISVPLTVDEAIQRQHEIRKPLAITVEAYGRYPNVVGRHYDV